MWCEFIARYASCLSFCNTFLERFLMQTSSTLWTLHSQQWKMHSSLVMYFCWDIWWTSSKMCKWIFIPEMFCWITLGKASDYHLFIADIYIYEMLVAYSFKYIKHNWKMVGFTWISVQSSVYKGKIVSDTAMEIRHVMAIHMEFFLGQFIPSSQEVTLDPFVLEQNVGERE